MIIKYYIQLSDNICEKTRTQEFLFKQIKKEYGYGYVPKYHKDIMNLNEYYINPRKNNLFLAKNPENDEIIATIAVRGYDKKFKEFEGLYNKEDTASIWRLYVDEKYRRLGLATKLFKLVESFSYLNNYKEIYLHTHKNLNGGLNFWKKMGFETTVDTNNDLQTVHMIKKLPKFKLNNVQSGYNLAIESLTLF